MMGDKSNYVEKGDTWFMSDSDCPRCFSPLKSNGKIHDCHDCEFWKAIGDEFDSERGKAMADEHSWSNRRKMALQSLGLWRESDE